MYSRIDVALFPFQNEEFANEADKESDMHFIDIDQHDLHSDAKKVEGEEKPDPPIFPNQAFLAKTIIERIAQILENNTSSRYKLRPLFEQWERTLMQAELDNCYTDFEFVIYTAISNMLEEQTAIRMMDPLSEVFPRSLYSKSSWKTMKEEADKRVKKYHMSSLASHKELVERVKSNPRTLFLIVADEAHVAITKKEDKKQSGHERGNRGERETETANDTMVNYWKDDEHPNVVVLQVRNIFLLFTGRGDGHITLVPPLRTDLTILVPTTVLPPPPPPGKDGPHHTGMPPDTGDPEDARVG